MKGLYFFLVGVIFLTGCSKAIVRSDSDPNSDLSAINSIYVRKLPADERGIEKVIENKLNEFGFRATSGVGVDPREKVDVIISYEDRWMWDITMYMLEIDINLHDPKTDFILASGSSYRTSLVRKSPEEMVGEVLREIFEGVVSLPEKKQEAEQEP